MKNLSNIKKDFPILNRKINNNSIVYLDSAATSQKPKRVIDAIVDYYEKHNANVHRGVHALSEESTDLYEQAREVVADFIGAEDSSEIIFTKGSTESLNTVAFGWVENNVGKGDTIIFCESDHHSNIVPWQVVAKKVGAKITVLKDTKSGLFDIDRFKNILDKSNIRFVAISHASNVLGNIYPVKEICEIAKKYNAVVSIDGAQAAPHVPVDIKNLGCDFYSFSSHKMLGPMGIGVLYGRKELLRQMSPCEYGGGMIYEVKNDNSSWADIPQRFEAGTPNVAGAVGLMEAIKYLKDLGMQNVYEHEKELAKYALKKLSKIKDLYILGSKDYKDRLGLVSFVIDGIHSHDLAAVLNEQGIAVRSGQHCTMPLHDKLDISSSTRASFYIYNTKKDIDYLVKKIKEAVKLLK